MLLYTRHVAQALEHSVPDTAHNQGKLFIALSYLTWPYYIFGGAAFVYAMPVQAAYFPVFFPLAWLQHKIASQFMPQFMAICAAHPTENHALQQGHEDVQEFNPIIGESNSAIEQVRGRLVQIYSSA